MLFRQIYDEKLSQYAYLIGCQRTGEALVIDPERDVDRYLRAADEEGLEITATAETHIHADFLSGCRELGHRHGCRVYLSGEGGEGWEYEWADEPGIDCTLLRHGDSFHVGRIEVRALHTPGHTPEHLAFLIVDHGSGADEPMGLVSGDFVFVGDLGRPDLLESAAKMAGAMEPSARRLYGSVQEFLDLPEWLQVWPGHGAGSACGKALGAVPETTVGYEKRFSPAIRAAAEGEDAFVSWILSGQPEPPMYFARMKRDNRAGPPILGELPRPRKLTAGELGEMVMAGETTFVDTRINRSAFMARHLPGALYAPLNRRFNTIVGSFVEDETTPLCLIVHEEEVEEAVRDLVRIGYDRIVAFAEPVTLERHFLRGGAAQTIEEIDLEEVERLRRTGAAPLDVRTAAEWNEGHVPGAVNASYTRLPEYTDRVPAGRTLLVYCQTGARAAAAASWLRRGGHDVRYVNDDFARFGTVGEVERAEPAPVGL